MNAIKFFKYTVCLLILTNFIPLYAQDVAFFYSIKGKVDIKDKSGKQITATIKTKLNVSDEVITGNDGYAGIMYYTGKEISLAPKQNYKIEKYKEENSMLTNLTATLSNLLWGSSHSGTIAGTTRVPSDKANYLITAIYPSEAKILEERPTFKWSDNRKNQSKNYVVVIRSEISDFKYEISVNGATEIVYPENAPKFSVEEHYVWTVKDINGTEISYPVHFSLLYPEDKITLQENLKKISEICSGNNNSPQWYLLTSALYWDYRLMRQAEESILNLIKLKPEAVQPYNMLAFLYRETGRSEDAKAQDAKAKSIEEKK
jgi:hypothetical protein